MSVANDARTIKAMPTKDFFISTLVRDIDLSDAIADLVDNCIDGARRIRPSGDFHGLEIRLDVSREQFLIEDNCGGMSVEIARMYAFRFGRPASVTPTPHSIGQFGVGMKRALFKIGKRFTIESTTESTWFRLDVDVEDWKAQEDDWSFAFADFNENMSNDSTALGTKIVVSQLHENIGELFSLDNYESRLFYELKVKNQQALEQGVKILLNGIPLQVVPLQILSTDRIHPGFLSQAYSSQGRESVQVKLYTGISLSSPGEAGWDFYCNGRALLDADKTIVTGWGEDGEQTIPRYHNQYARFKGFVLCDSNDASLLPWNTTKTGVDLDSALFKNIRQQMIFYMRPVIDFLNKLDAEKDLDPADRVLTEAVENIGATGLVDLLSVTKPQAFHVTARRAKSKKTDVKISYSRPAEVVEVVMKLLEVKTPREVGEQTFDYFARMEISE